MTETFKTCSDKQQNFITTVPLVHVCIKRLFKLKSHRAPAKRLAGSSVGYNYYNYAVYLGSLLTFHFAT